MTGDTLTKSFTSEKSLTTNELPYLPHTYYQAVLRPYQRREAHSHVVHVLYVHDAPDAPGTESPLPGAVNG